MPNGNEQTLSPAAQLALFIREEVNGLEKRMATKQQGESELREVRVENLDEVQDYLRSELGRFLGEFAKMILQTKSDNNEPRISHISEVRMPETLRMEDTKDILESLLSLTKILQSKEFSPTINVTSPEVKIPELKIPEVRIPRINVPPPQVTVNAPEQEMDFTEIIRALAPLKFISNKPGKPITVRLSDGVNFIKAVQDAASRTVQAFSQSVGMTVDEFKAAIPRAVAHKKVTVTTAGTPVQFSTTQVKTSEVLITGDTDAAIVCVVGGDDTVDASANDKNGIIIIPGNSAVTIRTNDLRNLWADAESNGGVLNVTYTQF